jgi:hypothetical protein
MLSVASAILFLGFAVGLDERQALHQPFKIGNAEPAADERQALPVKPAVAIGQQVENLEGLAVCRADTGGFVALIFDTGL